MIKSNRYTNIRPEPYYIVRHYIIEMVDERHNVELLFFCLVIIFFYYTYVEFNDIELYFWDKTVKTNIYIYILICRVQSRLVKLLQSKNIWNSFNMNVYLLKTYNFKTIDTILYINFEYYFRIMDKACMD